MYQGQIISLTGLSALSIVLWKPNVIVSSLALDFEREENPQGYQYVISIIYFISHFKRVADKCKHNLMDIIHSWHWPQVQQFKYHVAL